MTNTLQQEQRRRGQENTRKGIRHIRVFLPLPLLFLLQGYLCEGASKMHRPNDDARETDEETKGRDRWALLTPKKQ